LEGRIVVKSKPRQKVHETPSQPLARYNIMSLSSQAIRRLRLEELRFRLAWAKSSQDPTSTEKKLSK
jgi:hypothetical protein